MVDIQPGAAVVTVVTADRETFRARHLVIAAGAWTAALCSSIGLNLPFKVYTTVLHAFLALKVTLLFSALVKKPDNEHYFCQQN